MFGIIPFTTNLNSDRENSMGNFFDDFFRDSFSAPANMEQNKFKTDIKERENEYVIRAELPGLNKENISLDYKNNYLVVTAKKQESVNEKEENYIRKECSYGESSRSFYFDNIDKDKISAKFENGILTITLPKEVKKEDVETKIKIQ